MQRQLQAGAAARRVAHGMGLGGAVWAAVNSTEFSLREFNTGSFPKGLAFMLGVMRNWIYERDPVDALRFEQPLADLKKDMNPLNPGQPRPPLAGVPEGPRRFNFCDLLDGFGASAHTHISEIPCHAMQH